MLFEYAPSICNKWMRLLDVNDDEGKDLWMCVSVDVETRGSCTIREISIEITYLHTTPCLYTMNSNQFIELNWHSICLMCGFLTPFSVCVKTSCKELCCSYSSAQCTRTNGTANELNGKLLAQNENRTSRTTKTQHQQQQHKEKEKRKKRNWKQFNAI